MNAPAAARPRFSVAIPAFNEEALLPRLLRSLDAARSRYLGGAPGIEVIVGDNASTDATSAVASGAGCRVVQVERRSIAAARNGPGRAALGEWLCFVDADGVVHPEVFNAIDAALADRRNGMGATGLVLERYTAARRVTEALLRPMVRIMGIDGGLVFMRREDFDAVGGYDETRLVAEDVDLLFRVKRLCKARGQRFARLAAVPTITSTRKFDRHGEWHFLRLGLRMAWDSALDPKRFERTARAYWYEDR